MIEKYKELGFHYVGFMTDSDDFARDVDVVLDSELICDKPGVYIIADTDGKVLKIGESMDLNKRIFRAYKWIKNRTNDKVRNYMKKNGTLRFYVLPTPLITAAVAGFDCTASFNKSLERELLKDFRDNYDALPILNAGVA
jgi:hypothetical protein